MTSFSRAALGGDSPQCVGAELPDGKLAFAKGSDVFLVNMAVGMCTSSLPLRALSAESDSPQMGRASASRSPLLSAVSLRCGKPGRTHSSAVPSTPAPFLFNMWGTNDSSWGGTASPGPTRYMYISNFSYTSQ